MRPRQVNDSIIHLGCREFESLANIVVFQLWILETQFITIRVKCREFDDAANSETKVAHARLSIHPGWIAGDLSSIGSPVSAAISGIDDHSRFINSEHGSNPYPTLILALQKALS